MARQSDRPRTDIQKIIEWYEDDIRRYEGMIGQETEYRTIVTKGLIDNIKERVKELKQREGWWNVTRREFAKQD